jgi:hypothetical protein
MIAIFLFYNQSNGVQARLAFSKTFKHCNIITYDGDYWVNYELDSYGVHTRVLEVKEGVALIRGLKIIKELVAMVVVWIDKRARFGWKPWWVRSCNEYNRYVGAVDIGFTFNPRHLFSKLLKYDKKRNFEILQLWRR